MKILKFISFFFIFLITVFIIVALFEGYPIVLNFSENIKTVPQSFEHGDTIKPFDKFDFNKGTWVAYLFISNNDKKELSKQMTVGKYKTTDIELLKRMQTDSKFIFTSGDIATVESQIILCFDGKQVFESGIVLDSLRQGLQSWQYGWLEAPPKNNLASNFAQFKKIYMPIIILK